MIEPYGEYEMVNGGVVNRLVDEIKRLRAILNPSTWTKAQREAWALSLPNSKTQEAFDALIAASEKGPEE